MKTILLALFLLIVGTGYSQTYQADTLRYFSNVMDTTKTQPDTTIVQDILIKISGNYLNIRKWDANFVATIIDTINISVMGRGVYIVNCNIRTVSSTNGKIYNMELHLGYLGNELLSVGLSRNAQLFLYHIVNKLIDGQARKPRYLNEWLREAIR